LERQVGARLHERVRLSLTNNTSTMISFDRTPERLALRVHRMFLEADASVVGALAKYVGSDDRAASRRLDAFIEARRGEVRKEAPEVVQQHLRLETRGRTHDLAALFRGVRAHYERVIGKSARGVVIGWAPTPPVKKLPRKTIRLGSYSTDARAIRVHPALDQAFVPANFVRWIIFHELLHDAFRGEPTRGRGAMHPPAFRKLEYAYPEAHSLRGWEHRNIVRLLSWDPEPNRRSPSP
jgi:hypothetical protein